MTTYCVTLYVDVEADDEDQARERGYEMCSRLGDTAGVVFSEVADAINEVPDDDGPGEPGDMGYVPIVGERLAEGL